MGGEQSQAVPPSTNKTPVAAHGSQMAPAMGGKPRTTFNVKEEINKDANKDFAQKMVVTHNKYRARHKAPPVKLNPKLNAVAQEWATRISTLGNPDSRPPTFQFGQNLYFSRWATDTEAVCASWYKEGQKYQYDKEPDPPPVTNSKSVNFTQMIWKSSIEIGVGIASSWNNVTYIVVNYKPKGNVKGEYKKNVLPIAQVEKVEKAEVHRRISIDDKTLVKPPSQMKPAISVAMPLFSKKMLQLINEFRDTHGVKGLKLNGVLNELAQSHANLMAQLRNMEPFKGKVSPPVGVSLYSSKWYIEPKDACQFWYSEAKRYKYVEPSIVSLSTVNFVQMVWAATKDVGFGRAEAAGYTYIAAFYRPIGNVLGEFSKNVKPFRVTENMHPARTDDFSAARKSKAVSVILPSVS